MPRRWLVNTSNNRLVGVIDDDDAAVPAGREGVAQNVITASGVPRADIKTNGLWVSHQRRRCLHCAHTGHHGADAG